MLHINFIQLLPCKCVEHNECLKTFSVTFIKCFLLHGPGVTSLYLIPSTSVILDQLATPVLKPSSLKVFSHTSHKKVMATDLETHLLSMSLPMLMAQNRTDVHIQYIIKHCHTLKSRTFKTNIDTHHLNMRDGHSFSSSENTE